MASNRAGIAPITIALKVDMDNATKQAAAAANETTNTVIKAYNKIGALQMGAIGGVVGAVSGIGAALLFGVGAASKFEDSFAGIRKTVEASESEFNTLAMSIRDMALELPVATSELNAIGELGGQLGIESSGLPVFIDTIAKLGVATRLSSETAALSLARLKEIFQLPEQQIANLGSALVDLGNNFAALEDEILSTALRLAAGAKVAGATAADTLAIATALQAVGVQSQAGGTAMARVFQAMTTAVQTGGTALTQFVRVTGLTEESFKTLATQDPAQVLALFLDGISRIANEGGNYIKVLEDLNLKQQRTIRAVLALAEADGLLEDALIKSNVAYDINNALTEEANKRFDTLRSRNKLLKNSFQELRIEVGTAFLPAMKTLSDTMTTLLQAFRDNEAEMGKFGNLAGAIIGTFTILGIGMGAIVGQFFSIRAQADFAGLSLKQFKSEVLQMNAAIKAGNASMLQNNAVVSQTTAKYIGLGAAIKGAMGVLMPVLTALSIAFMANSVANERARKTTNTYLDAVSRTIPLLQKIREEEKLLNDLRNEGATDRALDFQNKTIAAMQEELATLQAAEAQLFLNIPKMMDNLSQEQVSTVNDLFKNINAGVSEMTNDMKLLEEASGVNIFQPLEKDTEAFQELAKTLSVSTEDLREIMSGDISNLFRVIMGEITAGASPQEISQALDNFYMQLAGATEFSLIDSIFPEGAANEDTQKAARRIQEYISVVSPIISNRLSGLEGAELELISEGALEQLERYNAVAKETSGIDEVTMFSFKNSAEVRAKVYQVLQGDIEGAQDQQAVFNEKINDMLTLLSDALDKSFTLENAFNKIGQIEFFDTSEIQDNINRGKNLKNFLDLAVSDLIEQGFGGIAIQAAEAGLEVENLSQLFAMVTGQIGQADLEAFNESIIDGKDEYASFQDMTEEVKKGLLESLNINVDILSVEERRTAVAELQKNIEEDTAVITKGVLSVVKELISMKRAEVDDAEKIASLQKEILDYNKDLVFDTMTITQAQRDQLEIANAKREVEQAISDFGAEGVVTDKEALQIAQMALNLEQMREKISAVRTARERKSIRDKQKEVKFLELAVEQGVAENLDLDAAREELEEMQNPLSQAEKDILELQIKLAEAEEKTLKERSKTVSPEIISAIERYNTASNISKERADELAGKMRDLARAQEDSNIQMLENEERLREIKLEYPGLIDMASEIAGLIGVPASFLQEALQSYSDSYDGFVEITQKIANITGNGTYDYGEPDDGQNPDDPVSTGGAGIYNPGDSINIPGMILGPNGRSSISTNRFGLPPQDSLLNSSTYKDLSRRAQALRFLEHLNMSAFMSNAYGGSVPIGRASIVGEMGPEVIMSTPSGTSVFANKTGGGYGGVTVENMNVNITGLPADPISARKAAINIRKELTKLENEGSAGTGLRNR